MADDDGVAWSHSVPYLPRHPHHKQTIHNQLSYGIELRIEHHCYVVCGRSGADKQFISISEDEGKISIANHGSGPNLQSRIHCNTADNTFWNVRIIFAITATASTTTCTIHPHTTNSTTTTTNLNGSIPKINLTTPLSSTRHSPRWRKLWPSPSLRSGQKRRTHHPSRSRSRSSRPHQRKSSPPHQNERHRPPPPSQSHQQQKRGAQRRHLHHPRGTRPIHAQLPRDRQGRNPTQRTRPQRQQGHRN